jgi:segregation and condensation protein B
MNSELVKKIESLLFYLAEPVSISSLAKTLEVSKEDVESGVEEFGKILEDRGLVVVRTGDEVVLTTAPEMASTIEKMIKEERERDLGRAGIETLSIIAYKGPVSKKEIEYIRGVNSQYALRSLLLRGLVEKKNSSTDERVVVYNITLETLRFLGLKSVTDLPEYEEMKKQLDVQEEVNETEIGEDHGE